MTETRGARLIRKGGGKQTPERIAWDNVACDLAASLPKSWAVAGLGDGTNYRLVVASGARHWTGRWPESDVRPAEDVFADMLAEGGNPLGSIERLIKDYATEAA